MSHQAVSMAPPTTDALPRPTQKPLPSRKPLVCGHEGCDFMTTDDERWDLHAMNTEHQLLEDEPAAEETTNVPGSLGAAIDYQCAVNAAVIAAGYRDALGERAGVLSEDEMHELRVVYQAGMPAETFARQIIARRAAGTHLLKEVRS